MHHKGHPHSVQGEHVEHHSVPKQHAEQKAVELPDTGEADNNGASTALLLALGGFTVLASRRKREEF
ncbi:LPXTG cell wall anchor domain-containing protein [Macrococcoides canis]